MLHRIDSATAHPDHTLIVTWSDGATARVDLAPVVAKGNVFAPMQDAGWFVARMTVAADRLGVEWPNRVDLSADGLRFRAFPDEEAAEFEAAQPGDPGAVSKHAATLDGAPGRQRQCVGWPMSMAACGMWRRGSTQEAQLAAVA